MKTLKSKTIYSTGEKLFLILWTFYAFFYFLFRVSELTLDYDVESIFIWARDLTMVFQVILLFYMNKNSTKRMLLCFVVLLLTFLVESSLASQSFQITILFILLASQLDFDKLLRFDFKLKIILLAVIIVLCLVGITENYSAIINGTFKQALGFQHPNTLTCYVLILLAEWMCIRCKRMKWFEWPLILAIWAVVMEVGGGRTSGYTFIVIYLLFALANVVPKIFYTKISEICFAIITPLMAIISFVTVWLYNSGNAMISRLNSVITNRISHSSRFLDAYEIKLFGQKIETVSSREHFLTGEPSRILDNAYIRFALNWGAVLFIIILVLFSLWFIRTLKEKKAEMALLGLFFVILGFGESYMTNPLYDIPFLFLLNGLNDKNADKELSQNRQVSNTCEAIHFNYTENAGCFNIIMGIALILLVWSTVHAPGSKYVSRMIYPFIFLAFGLFYNLEKSLKQYVLELLKTIYIPFAFWNILFYTIRSIYSGKNVQAILSMDFNIILTLDKDGSYFGTTWILGGLVLVPLVYSLIDVLIPKFKYREYFLLCLYGLIAVLGFQFTLPYKMSRILILGFFFAVGAFLKKNADKLKNCFYPGNAVICALVYIFIAYNHSADMGSNAYSNAVLFVIGALFAAYALIVLIKSLNQSIQRFSLLTKKGLSYLGKHLVDVILWLNLSYKLIIMLQMALNNEKITWTAVLSYNPTYSTAYGWWITYAVVGIGVPILLCNLIRLGPWGKLFKKMHIV